MARITDAELPDDLPFKNNLIRATFNNPDMHRGFASLSGRVHSASNLPGKIRELVVLAVAAKLGAEVEWNQHVGSARRQGVTEEQLVALRSGDMTAFDGAERAAVTFAVAVDECAVDEAAWAVARERFSALELQDMAMLAGFYGLASRYVLALGVEVD
jgi:alkylhydroperoxidase family enzyme